MSAMSGTIRKEEKSWDDAGEVTTDSMSSDWDEWSLLSAQEEHSQHRPPMLSLQSSPSLPLPNFKYRPVTEEVSSGNSFFGAAARKGKRRSTCDDRYSSVLFAGIDKKAAAACIFGIFDGHGGQRAAAFASERLPQLLLTQLSLLDSKREAVKNAFLKTDAEFLASTTVRRRMSSNDHPGICKESTVLCRAKSGGSFAQVALQRATVRLENLDNTRTSALLRSNSNQECAKICSRQSSNRGNSPLFQSPLRTPTLSRSNSRAEDCISNFAVPSQTNCGTTATVLVLIGMELVCAHVGDSRAILCRDGEAIRLCEDHRPYRRDELERIEAAGGIILTSGGMYRVNGILGVSRAIGDRELKEFVIAEPEINTREISEQDEFLIVASDGLWDVVDDNECVEITQKILHDSSRLDNVAKGLTAEAFERGSKDDISVIVVDLRNYATLLQEQLGCVSSECKKTPNVDRYTQSIQGNGDTDGESWVYNDPEPTPRAMPKANLW